MTASVAAADVELVRSFNRLVTRQLGALADPYLGRRPLGECRVLYEIGTGAAPETCGRGSASSRRIWSDWFARSNGTAWSRRRRASCG